MSRDVEAAGSGRPRWRTRGTRWAILVPLSLLAACAGLGSPAVEADPGSGAGGGTATLELSSSIPGPVLVYAVSGSLRVRLGTASTARRSRLAIPRDLVGRGRLLRFVARPIGDARTVTTEGLAVEAGDVVEWRLQLPIETSIATVRLRISP